MFVCVTAGVVNTKSPVVTVAAVTISLTGIRTHWEVLANTGELDLRNGQETITENVDYLSRIS